MPYRTPIAQLDSVRRFGYPCTTEKHDMTFAPKQNYHHTAKKYSAILRQSKAAIREVPERKDVFPSRVTHNERVKAEQWGSTELCIYFLNEPRVCSTCTGTGKSRLLKQPLSRTIRQVRTFTVRYSLVTFKKEKHPYCRQSTWRRKVVPPT